MDVYMPITFTSDFINTRLIFVVDRYRFNDIINHAAMKSVFVIKSITRFKGRNSVLRAEALSTTFDRFCPARPQRSISIFHRASWQARSATRNRRTGYHCLFKKYFGH